MTNTIKTVISNDTNTIQNGIFHDVHISLDGTVRAIKFRYATKEDEEYGIKEGSRMNINEYDWSGNDFKTLVDMAEHSGHEAYFFYQEEPTTTDRMASTIEKISQLPNVANLTMGDGGDGYADYYGDLLETDFLPDYMEEEGKLTVFADTDADGNVNTCLVVEIWGTEFSDREVMLASEEIPFKRVTKNLINKALKTLKRV